MKEIGMKIAFGVTYAAGVIVALMDLFVWRPF